MQMLLKGLTKRLLEGRKKYIRYEDDIVQMVNIEKIVEIKICKYRRNPQLEQICGTGNDVTLFKKLYDRKYFLLPQNYNKLISLLISLNGILVE
jgi:hypothetical protein